MQTIQLNFKKKTVINILQFTSNQGYQFSKWQFH